MIKLSILFGLIVGLSHFEGGLVTLFCQDRSRFHFLNIFQPLSSGALIAMAIIQLIPLSIRLLPWSPVVLLGAITGLMIFSEFSRPERLVLLTPRWGKGFFY